LNTKFSGKAIENIGTLPYKFQIFRNLLKGIILLMKQKIDESMQYLEPFNLDPLPPDTKTENKAE